MTSARPFRAVKRILGIALLSCAACQSPWHGYRFVPPQAKLAVTEAEGTQLVYETLVALRGIRVHDEDFDRPAEIVVRVYFENRGFEPLAIDLKSFRIVNGERKTILPKFFRGAPLEPIPPGKSSLFEMGFPIPAGLDPGDEAQRDLDLFWTARTQSREFPGHLKFVGVVVDAGLWGYDPDAEDLSWPIPEGGLDTEMTLEQIEALPAIHL